MCVLTFTACCIEGLLYVDRTCVCEPVTLLRLFTEPESQPVWGVAIKALGRQLHTAGGRGEARWQSWQACWVAPWQHLCEDRSVAPGLGWHPVQEEDSGGGFRQPAQQPSSPCAAPTGLSASTNGREGIRGCQVSKVGPTCLSDEVLHLPRLHKLAIVFPLALYRLDATWHAVIRGHAGGVVGKVAASSPLSSAPHCRLARHLIRVEWRCGCSRCL